ncbi:response regulator [Rhizobium wenxiniae]|uniref:response regulator n=1 Tax=Rhizobium wenxiniae TaxID=1737357 RepID=UPI003C26C34E
MQQATVLIVEDEPIIRMTVADDFLSAGFEVLEASNADEALAILETQRPITAIFSDIDMPGSIDGLELARLVRDRWPPVHIILTSGHKKPQAEHLPDRVRFLPKPYLHQTVIGALKSLME